MNSAAHGTRCDPVRRPGDEELVNVAAGETLLHGGAVHLFDAGEAPRDRPLPAAILRLGHAWAPGEAAAPAT